MTPISDLLIRFKEIQEKILNISVGSNASVGFVFYDTGGLQKRLSDSIAPVIGYGVPTEEGEQGQPVADITPTMRFFFDIVDKSFASTGYDG